jgi:nucleoid-associated protein YgaU
MRMIRSNLDEKEAAALAAYRASQQQEQVPQEPVRSPESSGSVSYAVHRGDTLSGIAEWFYGDRGRWRDIYAANRSTIRDPETLEAGTVLRIPRERGGKQLA